MPVAATPRFFGVTAVDFVLGGTDFGLLFSSFLLSWSPRTAVAFYLPDNLKRANALRLTARPEPCLLMFCQLVFPLQRAVLQAPSTGTVLCPYSNFPCTTRYQSISWGPSPSGRAPVCESHHWGLTAGKALVLLLVCQIVSGQPASKQQKETALGAFILWPHDCCISPIPVALVR